MYIYFSTIAHEKAANLCMGWKKLKQTNEKKYIFKHHRKRERERRAIFCFCF